MDKVDKGTVEGKKLVLEPSDMEQVLAYQSAIKKLQTKEYKAMKTVMKKREIDGDVSDSDPIFIPFRYVPTDKTRNFFK